MATLNDCSSALNCCDCGREDFERDGCGCRYCYSCNACETCLSLDANDNATAADYLECDRVKHADRW